MRSASHASRVAVGVGLAAALSLFPEAQEAPSLRFEVTLPPEHHAAVEDGRLIVTAAPVDGPVAQEPRLRIGRVGRRAAPIAAIDVDAVQGPGGWPQVLDHSAMAFPGSSLLDLPVGEYRVQAVLDLSRDHQLVTAPGNLYSRPRVVSLDPSRDILIQLALTERLPVDPLPPDTEFVRFVDLRSELLSEFHGRPFFLKAAVVLPRQFDDEPDRRYPLRISIGGFAQRATEVTGIMREGSPFRAVWLADGTPKMLRVFLDGAGPYGDPYHVNSDNNGPYGDAVTTELIPYIEARFRGVGTPESRVLDGSSTGGWVSLALQIFYPDFFNGAWSFCPDAVDFRALQRVNIYTHENAYVDAVGAERPSRRATDGAVRFTMRHELMMENVLGRGNSWTRSGQQWGSWNAVYGPRGDDGFPAPLWHPTTGVINREMTTHWERYDLRLVLARNWTTLRPKLDEKLNIWVGEMDDYYLNEAVHLLDDFFAEADPSFQARITFGTRQGHCWVPLSERALLHEMGRRTGATR